MITRQQKESFIQTLEDHLSRSKAFFIVDFKGLTVEKVTQLRKNLVKISSDMKVVRNTLALIALKRAQIQPSGFEEILTGNNAFVFAFDDVVQVAKTLADFAKDNEFLKIKSGFMDGRILNQKDIIFLATLPSKEVLQAQLLGALQAPAQKLLGTLIEGPSRLARVLQAFVDKNSAA